MSRVDEIVESMVRGFAAAADLSSIALAHAERAEARALRSVVLLARLDGRAGCVDSVWDNVLFHSREACAHLEAAVVFEDASAEVTPALLAFLATPFGGDAVLERFKTVDAAGPMVIDGFEYDDGWFVSARGRCARVAFEENDPYYPQGTWIVECDGVVEYISGCELDTVVLTVR